MIDQCKTNRVVYLYIYDDKPSVETAIDVRSVIQHNVYNGYKQCTETIVEKNKQELLYYKSD